MSQACGDMPVDPRNSFDAKVNGKWKTLAIPQIFDQSDTLFERQLAEIVIHGRERMPQLTFVEACRRPQNLRAHWHMRESKGTAFIAVLRLCWVLAQHVAQRRAVRKPMRMITNSAGRSGAIPISTMRRPLSMSF